MILLLFLTHWSVLGHHSGAPPSGLADILHQRPSMTQHWILANLELLSGRWLFYHSTTAPPSGLTLILCMGVPLLSLELKQELLSKT